MKLKQTKGETLAETLAAVLLISLAALILAGALVSAARVNNRTRNAGTAFQQDGGDGVPYDVTVQASWGSETYRVRLHQTENRYCYYDYEANP